MTAPPCRFRSFHDGENCIGPRPFLYCMDCEGGLIFVYLLLYEKLGGTEICSIKVAYYKL